MYAGSGSPYQLPPYQPKPALTERVADISKETYTWLRDYVTAIRCGTKSASYWFGACVLVFLQAVLLQPGVI